MKGTLKKTMKTAKPQTIEQEHRWSIDRSAQMSPDKYFNKSAHKIQAPEESINHHYLHPQLKRSSPL